jgi:hypothetical protein
VTSNVSQFAGSQMTRLAVSRFSHPAGIVAVPAGEAVAPGARVGVAATVVAVPDGEALALSVAEGVALAVGGMGVGVGLGHPASANTMNQISSSLRSCELM